MKRGNAILLLLIIGVQSSAMQEHNKNQVERQLMIEVVKRNRANSIPQENLTCYQKVTQDIRKLHGVTNQKAREKIDKPRRDVHEEKSND